MEEQEVMTIESGTIALLNKSEIEQQVATAHKFPRSIKKFRDETMQMVTLTEKIAGECIYSLPRGGKTIEGPSARFAEVIASAWGNSRAGARVVSDQGEFVTAQGVFHDLEKNVAITYEVQRRITDKAGRRFATDMIGVTANAACSIALRNAILKGVPKAFWADMYDAARATVMGDFKTLANRRADAIKAFQSYGVTQEQICATLGVSGIEDIGLEKLVTLRGILTAIKDGDTTPEQAFSNADLPAATPKMPQSKSAAKAKTEAAATDAQEPAETKPAAAASQSVPASSSELLSGSQINLINSKMEADALGSADLFAKFGVKLGDLTQDRFQEVLDWIRNPAA
ncbi:hypothetical protein ACFOFO_05340 [Undibacterium arcticum]|uniref:Uncharacterized protein n=1 Tax=Undibacterium arcticum TaxID=1762892 RepID=A0ABV7F115_9BURK